MLLSTLELSQSARYGDFYGDLVAWGNRLRFDVRYRCQRLPEVLSALGVDRENRRVLDIGFGSGDLLATFPESCEIWGVDVSTSAVHNAEHTTRFSKFRGRTFTTVSESSPWSLPRQEFDIIVTSHTLEHVRDDARVLGAAYERLVPSGIIAIFVPIEEPDYIPFHLRSYSLQSITERVQSAGFEIAHVEGSLYVNGHIWKILTIPSRRNWPVLKHVVDVARMVTLGAIPYPCLRQLDELLYRLGAGARQALVIARKPPLTAPL